jgi:hydroxymethylglutaryl-CoA lyase
MKEAIKIVEVGPRDGLQNEKTIVSTEVKIALITQLIDSGLTTIEATSFVSPTAIPQMADHEAVVARLPNIAGVQFPVLVPNQQGLENALRCGVKNIAVFAAASETFSQKNIRRSIDQSLQEYGQVIANAKQAGLGVRGYVSCVLGCPYEGNVPVSMVVKVAKALFDAGCEEISLGDTIGIGTPIKAQQMVAAVQEHIAIEKLAVHFHDTYGQALANIYACLERGIRIIDSSVAGLGGCPYAKGATGNVATEEVVYMVEGMGFTTGVVLEKLIAAGQYICQQLDKKNQSKVAIALLAKK